ncbi:MAG: TerB family tellurite resistance protein [Planctomycetota bacterium]|jgi:tellurite resistance protein
MGQLVIAILIFVLAGAAVVVIFPDVFGGLRFSQWFYQSRIAALLKLRAAGRPTASIRPDLRVLNCRVEPARDMRTREGYDTFVVEACGSIRGRDDKEHVLVQVGITDVTEGPANAQPVQGRLKQWQANESGDFCCCNDLGRIPGGKTILADWVTVAEIEFDWLVFPRAGTRRLRFSVALGGQDSGEKLGSAECNLIFENSTFGYLDLQQNIQRARTLAVALGFAVSAVDKKLYDCEVEVIREWARSHVDTSRTSKAARDEFDQAFEKTVDFFRKGNQLDNYKICEQLVKIVPLAERYDILELCLRVAGAKGRAAEEELNLLKTLAKWLEVDANRFRAMVENILPVTMHEVEDFEVILGVTSDMDKEETLQHLNEEYRKWNARVTSCDPEIQAQADQMLKFIAEARSEYAV